MPSPFYRCFQCILGHQWPKKGRTLLTGRVWKLIPSHITLPP
jgi:hypothetical protein